MTTLANAISKAVSTALLSTLPSAFAEKFELEAEAVKEFLNEFLASQLPKSAGKGSRTTAKKGSNGKGATSGYILFSSVMRNDVIEDAEGEEFFKQVKTDIKNEAGDFVYEDVLSSTGERILLPKIPFGEVGRRLGQKWRALSDAEKAEWNAKAVEANTANGLPPAEKKASKKASVEAVENAPMEMKITRDIDTKAWVVVGTSFVVKSPKNKAVIGKIKDGKVVTLTTAEKATCVKNGWETA